MKFNHLHFLKKIIFFLNKKPNKRRKELSELTFDINYALVGSKRLGSYQGRSVFKGLRRDRYNAEQVSVAISASNGIVIEE